MLPLHVTLAAPPQPHDEQSRVSLIPPYASRLLEYAPTGQPRSPSLKTQSFAESGAGGGGTQSCPLPHWPVAGAGLQARAFSPHATGGRVTVGFGAIGWHVPLPAGTVTFTTAKPDSHTAC
jgi:hypothetical protein